VSGLLLVIGLPRTLTFFGRKEKWRGTACFLGGILLVFLKWPKIGMALEAFGFMNLFGCVVFASTRGSESALLLPCPICFWAKSDRRNTHSGIDLNNRDFFPVVVSFLRRLPLIGPLLNAPGISSVSFSILWTG
jgi:hypothetical protein